MTRIAAVIAFLLGVAADLSAQSHELRFQHLQIEDGLSQTTVRSVLQDSRGFIWLGTQNGLNRYDGHNIRVLKPDHHFLGGLSNADIYALLEDHEGYLWIGTADGLNRYDPATEQFTVFLHDPSDARTMSHGHVTALFEDSEGTLWVGTGGAGINSFNRHDETFTRYPHGSRDPHSLSNGEVHSIYEDSDGRLRIGVDGGVDALDRAAGRFIHHISVEAEVDSLSRNSVLAIHEDVEGVMWFGTTGSGLFAIDPRTQRRTTYSHNPRDPSSLSHNTVSSIYEDAQGTLWVGTDGGGLNRFDRETGEFTRYRRDPSDPDGLADDRVLAVVGDRSGVIWVGTYGRGVDRFDTRRPKFTATSSVSENSGRASDFVRAFLVDRGGVLWIGREESGLSTIDRQSGTITVYRHDPADPKSLSNDRVFSLLEDQNGAIWVGTAGGFLNRFEPGSGTFTRFRLSSTDSARSGASVRVLRANRDERIWAGTDGDGLHLFDPATGGSVHYTHDPNDPKSLSSDRVFALHQTEAGVLWAGTFGGGLNRLGAGLAGFSHYITVRGDSNSLANDHVLTIYEDASGVLWLGSNGGGVGRFDPGTGVFSNYSERDGLPNGSIYGIVGDAYGRLWLSHNKGLSRFDPESETFKNYETNDGLQSNEFNGGAYYRSNDGEIFFGGINGYNSFYPDSVRDDPRVPVVVITDLQLNTQSVPVGENAEGRTILTRAISDTDQLTLSHGDRVISFEYAGLLYWSTDEVEYAYMLEGLDDDWVYAGSRRFATYTHVPPGRYVFKVKAANGDGVWNESAAAIRLRVTPPIWKTPWFAALLLLALVATVWALHQNRTRMIRVRARILEQNVHSRTAELEREIAERKEVEQQLAQAHDAALQATKSKSEFLATMSHEIRTPMNGVLGVVQLLMDTDLDAEQLDYARTIQASGDTLLGIINDILDFSKVEAGKLDIEPIPFDLQIAAAEVTDLLTPKAVEKGIEIVLLYHPDAPRYLIGDAGRVRQIILNLASNAVKFTEKGHALIEVEGIGGDENEAEIKISIHDTGIGIDEEEKARLFQSFSQADASTTRRFGGTGLGLAICKRLVELMGGDVGVESEPGQGSVFWFTLRLARAEEPTAGEPQDVDLIDLRVLVVDDLEVNRKTLCAQLVALGMRPHEAASGPEALESLREGVEEGDPYVICILDFQMPGMDGEQLGRAIKEDPSIANTSLVLLTSAGRKGDARRLQEAGFAGYLTKTTCRDTIRDVVATVASGMQNGGSVQFVTRHTVAEAQARSSGPVSVSEAIVQRRVLLAEDNIVNQKVAKRMLEKLGCNVDVASDGKEAVEMWSQQPYEIVFMDCQMPELDGYAATRAIRERETDDYRTPIVAMTANAMEGDRERCLEAGMDDYIAKPVRTEMCREALERWGLRRKRASQARHKVA